MNLKKLIEYPKQGIISKDISRTKNENISLFCMAKGSSMDEHTSTKKVLVYVIEGSGVFNIGSKKISMKPGELITLEKNKKHSLKADKKTAFLLIIH